MKYPLFSVRDVKGNMFGVPEIQVNNDVAKRMFDFRLHNDNSMGFSPADYELYCVGWFDVGTGQIDSQLPEFIINGGEIY